MTNAMLEKMEKTFESFEESVRNIRSGSVASGFIDSFRILYYGSSTPIKHVAYTADENGLVMIKPYDVSIIGLIETSLKDAGLNAYLFSKEAVAVSVPPISGDERERVKKHVRKLGEEAKVHIRNIRKQYRNKFEGTEDEKKAFEASVQKATDAYINNIDKAVLLKLEELNSAVSR